MRFQLGVTQRRIANSQTDGTASREELLTKSIDNLKLACSLCPNEPTYSNNLGLSYFESEQFDLALQAYDGAIHLEVEKIKNDGGRSWENLSFYHKNLGLALYHQGDMERALEEYEKAIKYNDMNADNYFNRGNVRLNEENFDLAHMDFEAAIEREDRNAKFYHAKGLAYQAEAEKIAR